MAIPQSPEIIRQSREDERDQSAVKIIVLALIAVSLSFATAFFFFRFLETAQPALLLAVLGAGICALAATLLNAVLIKNEFVVASIALLEGLAPLLLFRERLYPTPSWVLVGGALLCGILLALASVRGARALKHLMAVRFFEISHIVIPRAITGFLVLVSVLTYLAYFEWNMLSVDLGKTLTGGVLRAAAPLVRIWIPSFREDASIHDTLSALARLELERTSQNANLQFPPGFTNDFSRLPPSFQAQIVEQVIAQFKDALEGTFGISVKMDASLTETAYDLAEARIGRLSPKEKTALGVALAFSLFSLAKGLTLFLSWIVSLLAFLLFKLLTVIGFAHIAEELRSREFVILS